MLLDGKSQPFIFYLLGYLISHKSFKWWMDLFEETKRVVRDPETYAPRGPTATLTHEEIDFVIELVRTEPGLFLSEMRERLYDSCGTLLSTQAIHQNLVNNLCITLKKAKTSNVRKSLVAKYAFVEKMQVYPADWLVFTGESLSFFKWPKIKLKKMKQTKALFATGTSCERSHDPHKEPRLQGI